MRLLYFAVLSQVSLRLSNADLRVNSSDETITKRPNEAPEFCLSGQFLDIELNECRPCPLGHYMPDLVHSQLRCYPCETVSENSAEVILAPCTKTQATTIGCKKGYFLSLAAVTDERLIRCYPCSACSQMNPPSFEFRSCGKSFDTVCCSRPDMAIVKRIGQSGYECQDLNYRYEKASQTQFPSLSPRMVSYTTMKSDVHLPGNQAFNLISNYFMPELQKKSSMVSTPTPQTAIPVKATEEDSRSSSFVLQLTLGLFLALSFLCNVVMLYRMRREKNAKMAPPLKSRLFQENIIIGSGYDSEQPLLQCNYKIKGTVHK